MNYISYIVITYAALSTLIVLFFALRTKKFLKTLLTSAIMGISTLLILYFTSSLTGFMVQLTPLTIGVSGVFGLPGIVSIVLCKLILGV